MLTRRLHSLDNAFNDSDKDEKLPVGTLTEAELEARYELVRTIGQGEFARVKLAVCRRTGHRVTRIPQLSFFV